MKENVIEIIKKSTVKDKPSKCNRQHCVLVNDTCENYMGIDLCSLVINLTSLQALYDINLLGEDEKQFEVFLEYEKPVEFKLIEKDLKKLNNIDFDDIQEVINNINTYGVTLDISIDVTPLQKLIDILKE